jgi:hypothetical protein
MDFIEGMLFHDMRMNSILSEKFHVDFIARVLMTFIE